MVPKTSHMTQLNSTNKNGAAYLNIVINIIGTVRVDLNTMLNAANLSQLLSATVPRFGYSSPIIVIVHPALYKMKVRFQAKSIALNIPTIFNSSKFLMNYVFSSCN